MNMKYEIFGGSFPAATVTLNAGEKVFTQSGAMMCSDSSIEMSTNAEGGLLKSIGRMFSGASLMFVTHTATKDNSKVTFSRTLSLVLRRLPSFFSSMGWQGRRKMLFVK